MPCDLRKENGIETSNGGSSAVATGLRVLFIVPDYSVHSKVDIQALTIYTIYAPFFDYEPITSIKHAGSQVSNTRSLQEAAILISYLRSTRIENPAPLDYTTPPFPSLYWPLYAKPGVPNYLYYATDIWRFTLLWTLITYGVTHIAVAVYAIVMQLGKGKNAWQYVWVIPLAYALIAGIEALMAGSFVGLMWV